MSGKLIIDGKKLKMLREEMSLSQEGLEFACSQKAGCTVSIATIKRAELGIPLSRRTVSRLARFFEINIDDLLLKQISKTPKELTYGANHKTCTIFWLKVKNRRKLAELVNFFEAESPLFSTKVGNIIVFGFSNSANRKKTYLTLQSLALNLLSKKISDYSAYISLDMVSSTDESGWTLSTQQMEALSSIGSVLDICQITVSADVYQLSKQFFQYKPTGSPNTYSLIAEEDLIEPNEVHIRVRECSQITEMLSYMDINSSPRLLAIDGHNGMGKSHLQRYAKNMAKQKGYRVLDLNLEVHDFSEAYLKSQLSKTLEIDAGIIENTLENFTLELLEKNLSSNEKLVVSIDNLHLIDNTFLKTINSIINKLKHCSVLYIFSYTPSKKAHNYVSEISYTGLEVEKISLTPLSKEKSRSLAESFHKKTEPKDQSHYIDIAAGIPFYLLQLLENHGNFTTPNLPSTIVRTVEHTINNLSAQERKALACLTISIEPISLDSLQTILGTSPNLLEDLFSLNIIRPSFDESLVITHSFIKRHVIDCLHQDERNECYLILADHLETRKKNSGYRELSLISQYYKEAGFIHSSVKADLKSSLTLLNTGDYETAKEVLSTALEKLKPLEDSPENRELTLEMHLALAAITRATYGWVSHPTISAYKHCLNYAIEQDCKKSHCIALTGIWVTELMAMEFEASEKSAREIIDLAHQANDKGCQALAHACLSNTLFWRGQHAEAIKSAMLAYEHHADGYDLTTYQLIGLEPKVLAGCFGGLSASIIQDERSLQHFQKIRQDKAITAQPFNLAVIVQGEIWIAYHDKNYQQVKPAATELLTLSEQYGFPFYKGVALLFKGWAEFAAGDSDAQSAIESVSNGYDHWLAASGDSIAHSLYSLITAEIHLASNEVAMARDVIQYAISVAEEKSETCYLSPLYMQLYFATPEQPTLKAKSLAIATEQDATIFLTENWTKSS